jgi:ubiquinone/menaquinone biosynthesis C-methylase UbiE
MAGGDDGRRDAAGDRGGPGVSAQRHPLFARCLARSAAIAERKGADALRARLVEGLAGRVVEVGAGTGIQFRHYPPAVSEVVALEPEPTLRAMAQDAARGAPVAVQVRDGLADAVPLADAAADAAVCAGLLCSVDDPAAALRELARVIRPGGELRFYEHLASPRPRAATLQRALDATGLWRRAMGGCRTARRTDAAIRAAGFEITRIERFSFRPTLLDTPVAPKILGRARRP